MKAYINSLLVSFSYLILIRNPLYGFVVLLLIFTNPTSGVFALTAYFSSIFFGRYIGLARNDMVNGLFTYNSILIGLSIGYLFQLSFLSILITILTSFLTILLSFALYNIFYYYLGIPILNLPFTISATLIHLASIRYGSLFIAQNMSFSFLNIPSLPLWLSGLFKATGILMFLPYDWIGLLILVAMLFFSRIHFFLILTGYYAGTLVLGALKGSYPLAFSDMYNFNFILIALALGGFFLIPSFKSYIITLLSVITSVFVLDAISIFWSHFGIPAFTLPFVLVVSLVLYVLKITRFPFMTTYFLDTPEDNLEHYLNYSARFNIQSPQPIPPFSGEWKIYQGFDDEWTHKGIWKYAMDFVIENRTEQKTFKNDGAAISDYYSYNAPVLSPVSGTVVEYYAECKDNPIGTVDKQNNWGNYIIIKSLWNYYVQLSHLAEKSIVVKTGDRVIVGQVIGKCGNSGYSPQPHIHMQCSYFPSAIAPSIEFLLSHCTADGTTLFGNERVNKGQFIKPLVPSRVLQHKLQFVLDDSFSFDVLVDGKKESSLTCTVKMDAYGNYYFTDYHDNARIFFSNSDAVFSFFRFEGKAHSALKYFFLALPRVPLTESSVEWYDNINPTLLPGNIITGTFIKSFNHNLFRTKGVYRFLTSDTVTGTITVGTPFGGKTVETYCELAEYNGFNKIRVTSKHQTYEIVRIGNKE